MQGHYNNWDFPNEVYMAQHMLGRKKNANVKIQINN